jgi:predicted nicotinamide N-methyase
MVKPTLNILELGADCGIVDITFARCLPNISTLALTDLPAASEILQRNLTQAKLTLPKSSEAIISHQLLDWSKALPDNISSIHWDLILVADCTYNQAPVHHLVKTMTQIRELNKDVLVLLAMKERHENERVFFKFIDVGGWCVKEQCRIPLSMVGEETTLSSPISR